MGFEQRGHASVRSRKRRASLVFGLLLSFAPATASAFEGEFITRYRDTGVVDAGFSGVLVQDPTIWLSGVATTPDARVVVCGTLGAPGAQRLFVSRYTAAGALDRSFGWLGIGGLPWNEATIARDCVADSTGRILVVAQSGKWNWLLVRFTPQGVVDTSFGSGGTSTLRFEPVFPNNGSSPRVVRTGPGDQIVVVGGRNEDLIVARFTATGALDRNFGWLGVGSVAGWSGVGSSGVAVDPGNASITVAGDRRVGAVSSLRVLRFTSRGVLDEGFGQAGVVSVPAPSGWTNMYSHALVLQQDKVVIGGGVENPDTATTPITSRFALTRLTSSGALDGGFGTGGRVLTAFAGPRALGTALALTTDNKLVMAGATDALVPLFNPPRREVALARYTQDGVLDGTFGNAGRVTTIFDPNGFAHKMTLSAGNHPVVIGEVFEWGSQRRRP